MWSNGKQTTTMSDETRERLLALPGFVILGKHKGGNSYCFGYTEGSFSMSLSEDKTNFWWYGTAYSNFGTKHELTPESVRKNIERHVKDLELGHPDVEFEVWDVHDPLIPVEFDWELWLWGSQSSDKTLSGVVDKYAARNLRFRMKDTPHPDN
jgi:hypothetical protein